MEKTIGFKLSMMFLILLLSIYLKAQIPSPTDKVLWEKADGSGGGLFPYSAIKADMQSGLSNGTVTSVSATVPTGFSISGSPITTSGTLAITNNLAAGYVKSAGVGGAFTSVSTVAGGDISGNISGSAANVTGTIAVANGGTGTTTLSGYVFGNGTGAMTASSTIPTTALSGTISNAQLANNALTINGTSRALGSTTTIDLASVTGQGATTATATTFSGGLSSTSTTTMGGQVNFTPSSTSTASTLTVNGGQNLIPINNTATTTVTVTAGIAGNPEFKLILLNTSTGSVVINSSAAETFNGNASFTLTANSQNTKITLTKISASAYTISLQ